MRRRRPADRGQRQPPGELMSFVFSMMTPLLILTKYNVGLYDVMDEENKLLNFLRMEKWLQDRTAIRARPPSNG